MTNTASPIQLPDQPAKTADTTPRTGTIRVERRSGETDDQATARELLDPSTRHSFTALPYIGGLMGKSVPLPDAVNFSDALKANAEQAKQGDLCFTSKTLAAQALALDAIFGEFSRRAALNMNNHLEAAERYMRLALKAQANSRATMEALAKLHHPREQIVRHIHVNEGGQAIVADQVNHYAGGAGNAESDKQSHAAGALGQGSPLPCPDSSGCSMPVTGSEGAEAMPDARRHKSGRTKG